MAVMCSSALMFNVRFVCPMQMASQSLQFSWYTALFLSSFGMGSLGFDNTTSEGCLGVECCFDVVLIKGSFKLLTDSLDVR